MEEAGGSGGEKRKGGCAPGVERDTGVEEAFCGGPECVGDESEHILVKL